MSDTRALLLTDVVDSTKLSAKHDAPRIAAIWAAHDCAARDLLAAHRGREIDKSDGFLLMFERASDAVAYAVAYHDAIAMLDPPLRARAGLHFGEVALTENSPEDIARGAKPLEVDGLAKPVTARVMSLARGGQTLLTREAHAALGVTSLRVASHGHWRMRGIADPIELLEIGGNAAPFTPPPDSAKVYRVAWRDGAWLPTREIPHSLPSERDAFVGRHAELLDLARRMEDGTRLVSIVGIGGTGKTRLVARLAWTWLGDYPGGAWFCDLSEARSVEGIAQAAATALGVHLTADDAVAQLGHAIAGRGRCLIILDNFEQVARHAGETVGRWLDVTTEASFIVTTREVLGLRGEAVMGLTPLSHADAVELFLARASAAKSDFALTDADRSEVAKIVTLLDELPLAIELAAARARMMTPKQIHARLGDRFKLLTTTGARRDRQATLRGALDWSWDLLAPTDQAALAQLSVFEGGFTLEAAEAVIDLSAHADAPWALDVVRSLVDKSLVRQVSDERFDLLVSVQVYADERARALGVLESAHRRHFEWFAARGAQDALDAMQEGDGHHRLATLARDLDNILAACRRATARARWDEAAACLSAAWEVVQLAAPATIVAGLATDILAHGDVPAPARASTLFRQAQALRALGEPTRAMEACRRAISSFEAAGDRAGIARCMHGLGCSSFDVGQLAEARLLFEEALARTRSLGMRRDEAGALMCLANVRGVLGAIEEAAALYEEALAIHAALGNPRGQGHVLRNHGVQNLNMGRLDVARAQFDASRALFREVGDARSEALSVIDLGLVHHLQGRWDESMASYEQALRMSTLSGDWRGEVDALGWLGNLLVDMGRVDEAIATYRAGLVISREAGYWSHTGTYLAKLGSVLALKGETQEADSAIAEGEAIVRRIGDPVTIGVLLADRAVVSARRGDPAAARKLLDEAEGCAARVGAAATSEIGLALTRARAAIDAKSP